MEQQPNSIGKTPETPAPPAPGIIAANGGAVKKPAAAIAYDRRDSLMLAGAWLLGILFVHTVTVLSETSALGLGFTLCVLAFQAGLILYAREKGTKLRREGALLQIPIALLALCYTLFDSSLMTELNMLVLLCMISVSVILMFGGGEFDIKSPKILLQGALNMFAAPFRSAARPFGAAKAALSRSKNKTLINILIGVAVTLPVLAVVIGLLTGADVFFGDMVRGMLDSISRDLGEIVAKVIWGAVLAIFIFSAAWTARKRSFVRAEGYKCLEKLSESVSTEIIITALALLNIVYAVFVAVQFVYLFGGTAQALPHAGLTYAEYARSGFFELCKTAGLNITAALCCIQLVKREKHAAWAATRILCALMMAFTCVLLASAAYRMYLYIIVHGITVLRFLTIWGMFVMAALIAGVLIKLARPRFRFFRLFLATIITGYLILNYCDMDRIIASYNVHRYLTQQEGFAHEEYLAESLSSGAVPALVRLRASGYNDYKSEDRYSLRHETLDESIANKKRIAMRACSDFRSWNLSSLLAVSAE